MDVPGLWQVVVDSTGFSLSTTLIISASGDSARPEELLVEEKEMSQADHQPSQGMLSQTLDCGTRFEFQVPGTQGAYPRGESALWVGTVSANGNRIEGTVEDLSDLADGTDTGAKAKGHFVATKHEKTLNDIIGSNSAMQHATQIQEADWNQGDRERNRNRFRTEGVDRMSYGFRELNQVRPIPVASPCVAATRLTRTGLATA